MLVRSATKNDLELCEKLIHIREMKLATGEYMNKYSLVTYLHKDFFLVAEENNHIVGMIFGEKLKGKGSIVWMLTVDSRIRGKGIGTSLLQYFEQKMKKIGREWIMLYGYAKNKKVLDFYRKR